MGYSLPIHPIPMEQCHRACEVGIVLLENLGFWEVAHLLTPTEHHEFCYTDSVNRGELFKVKPAHCGKPGSVGTSSLCNKLSDSKELEGSNFMPYLEKKKGQIKNFIKLKYSLKLLKVTWYLQKQTPFISAERVRKAVGITRDHQRNMHQKTRGSY